MTKRPRLILKSSRFSNWSTSSLCFEVGNHAPHSPDAKESFGFHCCERNQRSGEKRGGVERILVGKRELHLKSKWRKRGRKDGKEGRNRNRSGALTKEEANDTKTGKHCPRARLRDGGYSLDPCIPAHRNWRGEGRRDLIFKCKQIYIVAKAPPPVTQNRGLRISPQNGSQIFSIIGYFFLSRLRFRRNKNDRDRCAALLLKRRMLSSYDECTYSAWDLFIVGTPRIGYF